MVITGLTRNQLTGNRPWVRIPPPPPLSMNRMIEFMWFFIWNNESIKRGGIRTGGERKCDLWKHFPDQA